MKKIVLIALFIMLPTVVMAESAPFDAPRWSLELKGGEFIPDIPNWSSYYGGRSTGQYGGAVAYKIIRQVEAGVEASHIRDAGQGYAPIHGVFAGHVAYDLVPVNAFVLLRGVFSEQQWIVPYVGGGWTRMYYKIAEEGQATSRGFADGSHMRAGIQFLLDVLDPGAANNMSMYYGIQHSYFFLEAERTRAMVDSATIPAQSINLGGTSWFYGILLEF